MRSLCHTNFEVGLLVLSALRALSLDTPCTEGKTSCDSTAMNALSKASNAAQSPVLSRDMSRSTQRPWVIRSSTTARTTYECYEGYLGITILPPGELTAEVGKPYNVACLIDPKLGLQAEDVDFTCDGSPIPETESHDNRIDATISSAEQGRYNLVCQGGEKVCWRSLRVGYPPLDVENLTCISRNWQALECSWTVPENAAHPASEDYRPYLAGALGHESCDLLYGCRPQDDHECCIWTNATYSPSAEDIQIYFVTQNPLGTATFRHNFSNFAIVLPNPPEKVTSEEKTPLRIQVTWQTPFSLREFPPGLLYRIDHRVSDVQAPPPFLVSFSDLAYIFFFNSLSTHFFFTKST
nr:cytokine receptor-like factor 1 [Penaeus vannamei]